MRLARSWLISASFSYACSVKLEVVSVMDVTCALRLSLSYVSWFFARTVSLSFSVIYAISYSNTVIFFYMSWFSTS